MSFDKSDSDYVRRLRERQIRMHPDRELPEIAEPKPVAFRGCARCSWKYDLFTLNKAQVYVCPEHGFAETYTQPYPPDGSDIVGQPPPGIEEVTTATVFYARAGGQAASPDEDPDEVWERWAKAARANFP